MNVPMGMRFSPYLNTDDEIHIEVTSGRFNIEVFDSMEELSVKIPITKAAAQEMAAGLTFLLDRCK